MNARTKLIALIGGACDLAIGSGVVLSLARLLGWLFGGGL